MARHSPAQETCTLARTIGVVGDWWTLLILRDALLVRRRRFDEFHRSLGIATNVLSRRLDEMVGAGLLERVPSDHPRSRCEYQATDKGVELWPVLAALLEWGNRWTPDEQARPRRLIHEACGGIVSTLPGCGNCDEPLHPSDLGFEQPGNVPRRRARGQRASRMGR